jgi:hypothetical protein
MNRNIIDYAMDDNGAEFRKELYAAIYDKVADHIEAKKQEVAENLLGLNSNEEELEDDYSDELDELDDEELDDESEELDESEDHTELHGKIIKAWSHFCANGMLGQDCTYAERNSAIQSKVPEATKQHINKAINNHNKKIFGKK